VLSGGYADYGRLADEDYKMSGDGGGTHNKENQLVFLPTAADLPDIGDKEKNTLPRA